MGTAFCEDGTDKAWHAIVSCIGRRRRDANRINIAGMYHTLEQFGRRDGQNARAGAKIEDGGWVPPPRDALQHAKTAARRTMMPGAESERGLDLDGDVIGLGRAAAMRAMNQEPPRPHRSQPFQR